MEFTLALASWLSVKDLEFLCPAKSKLDKEFFGNFFGMYFPLSRLERRCIREIISDNFGPERMASALVLGIKTILNRRQCQL